MDFRDFLAQETSATFRQALRRRAEQTERDLQALRETLNAVVGTLESAFSTARAGDAPETEFSGLIDRMAAAANDYTKAEVDRVRAEADRSLAAIEEQRADAQRKLADLVGLHNESLQKRSEAEEKIRVLLAALEDRRRSQEALVTSMGDLQAHADALQRTIDAERARVAGITQDLAAANSARERSEAAAQDAEAARRQHEHARKALERELLDARAVVDRARADSASLGFRLEAAVAERASFEAALAEANARMADVAAEHERARGALESELLQVRAELDQTRGDSAKVGARLEAVVAERTALQAAVGEARERMEHATAQLDAHLRQLDQRKVQLEQLEQAARDAESARRELQIKLDAAAEREGNLRNRLAEAEVESSEARAHADAVIRAAAEAPAPRPAAPPSYDWEQLIAAYEELEHGTRVPAVLMALTKGLSGQFARVALFGATGNALQGSYQLGFDIDKDITKIVIPMTVESVLTRAFASGRIETQAADSTTDRVGLPFGGTAEWCLALPVTLRGETLAVIYADHGEQTSVDPSLEASRLAFAELLRRHTTPVLTKLTVDLKAWAELVEYATLLLDEIEYVYASDVNAGKPNAELVERLTENLRCAYEAYARRRESTAASDAGSDLFEDRLNAVLDAKGALAFGRHLSVAAAALAASNRAVDPPSQPAAQAS